MHALKNEAGDVSSLRLVFKNWVVYIISLMRSYGRSAGQGYEQTRRKFNQARYHLWKCAVCVLQYGSH